MSSNYEWQQFQTKERMRTRLQQGEAHRRAMQGEHRTTSGLLSPVMLGLGMIIILWLFAGCTPASIPAAEAPAISRAEIGGPAGMATEPGDNIERKTTVTMADRIRLQDLRERNLSVETRPAQGPTVTMADRIRLQDLRERNLSVETASPDEKRQ